MLNLIVILADGESRAYLRRLQTQDANGDSALPGFESSGDQSLPGLGFHSKTCDVSAALQTFLEVNRTPCDEVDNCLVILSSHDEFPRWPSIDRTLLRPFGKSLLVVRCRPNLQSAWSSVKTGARCRTEERTICSITMNDTHTDVAICCAGEVIDTASLGIGPRCISFDKHLTITDISDTGETFLDAVAKKIKAADLVDETVISLISALIGEAVANLICRKKAPQVTQRLLNSDTLKQDYVIDDIILTGSIVHWILNKPADTNSVGHLGGYLANDLMASFAERNRQLSLIHGESSPDTVLGHEEMELELIHVRARTSVTDANVSLPSSINDVPLIAVPSCALVTGKPDKFFGNRIEERLRRYSIDPGTPIIISLNVPEAQSQHNHVNGEGEDLQTVVDQVWEIVTSARKAVDAAMFLKKPSHFLVLIGWGEDSIRTKMSCDSDSFSTPEPTIDPLRQADATAQRDLIVALQSLLAEKSGAPHTEILFVNNYRIALLDGDYISWELGNRHCIDDASSSHSIKAALKRPLLNRPEVAVERSQ